MRRRSRRYPFAPLERWIIANYHNPQRHDGAPSAAQIADLLGISRATIMRWRRDGLTERAADTAAIALGTHPDLLWPSYALTPSSQRTRQHA